tara:strand:+ start:6124 stop:6477 length:354 start_codon:yes stop_codon:yes gene_type:complete
MAEKNLYIRCDEETYLMARELAQKNLRSLNRQVIHLIHEAHRTVFAESFTKAEEEKINKSETKLTEAEIENVFVSNQEPETKEDVANGVLEDWESRDSLSQSGLEKLSEIRKSDSSD